MAKTETHVPYEILLRFDPAGLLAGAHYIRRHIVAYDGEVVRDDIGPAEPVAIGSTPEEGTPHVLADVLGEALAGATAAAAALTTRLDEAEERLAAGLAAATAAETALQAATARIAELEAAAAA